VKPGPPGEGRAGAPLVSVIIATFNWSAALRCAIRSVLRQTLQDFEIFVVGDGCEDDSEAVVAAFGDARVTWKNLPRNSGSQQAPNNLGLASAKGEWIAYLGHDDIWAPRHLEATIAAASAQGCDVAAGGMIMYGPPGTGVTSTAGLFAHGRCADGDFVPPSALVHRRSLIGLIGLWSDPRTLRLPIDCDFFQRIRQASPVAETGEITVFKFNAAARRNAYQTKSIVEQERCLAGLERGDRYIGEELVKVVRSMAEGRWSAIKTPDPAKLQPGQEFRSNRLNKGVDLRFSADELRALDRPERFTLDHEPSGHEWHAPERNETFGAFRWTGPSDRSTIELPIRCDRRIIFRIHVLAALVESGLGQLRLWAQGVPVACAIERTTTDTWLVRGEIDPALGPSPVPYVQIVLGGIKAARPADLGIRPDQRSLGLAIGWIELAPAPT
jgi:glycosyltransferase involved in cell wall biosynthesis